MNLAPLAFGWNMITIVPLAASTLVIIIIFRNVENFYKHQNCEEHS